MEVLASLFGSEHIVSLYDVAMSIRPDDAPELLCPADSDRFRQFLQRTLVVPCEGPGEPIHPFRKVSTFCVHSSIKQILEQLQEIIHRSKRGHHVLTNGAFASGLYWNTIRNHLYNQNWTLLLQRMGDEPIRMLLMRCSVFEPLSNGCYFQVSGKVLSHCRIKNAGDENSSQSPSHHKIKGTDLLYSRRGRCHLSKHHILNKAVTFENPAMELLNNIFQLDCNGTKLNRSYQKLLPLLRSMIKNHAKFNYERLLEATCHIPKEYLSQQAESENSSDVRLLLQQYSTAQEVATFLRHVVMRVIPGKIWGSKPNFAVICRAIHYLVNMRRKDVVDVHNLMKGFRISRCPWIFSNGGPSGARKSRWMFDCFIRWLFSELLVPVIRQYFYCTESEPYRNRVFYYRHEIWLKIQNLSIERLTEFQFEKVQRTDTTRCVSKLRLLPKMTTVRPLINCSFKVPCNDRQGSTSINSQLRNCLLALNMELEDNPQAIGSDSSGLNSIHDRISPFLRHIREISDFGEPPKVYIVGTDFTKCFDKIERPRLMQIVSRLLQHSDYFIYSWVSLFASLSGKTRARFHKVAMKASDIPQFAEFAELRSHLTRDTIFNEQNGRGRTSYEEILQLIDNHISCNIIQCHDSLFRQTCGIPQGSILSTILCSLYLADLERSELRVTLGLDSEDWFWTDPGSAGVLLRHVDDFLLMTTSKSRATAFLNRMLKGFDHYNCHVNPAKTRANFSVNSSDVVVNEVIPWCGYLFDSKKLVSCRGDYTRIVNHSNIADTISVQRTIGKRVGSAAKKSSSRMGILNILNYFPSVSTYSFCNHYAGRQFHRLCHQQMRLYIRSKLNSILLDSVINPRRVVALNIYQMFRLAFIKMCAYLTTVQANIHLNFIQQCFLNTLIAFHQTVKRRCQGQAFDVTALEVKWLALYALKHVLIRKQSRFRNIIMWLKDALRHPSMTRLSYCKHLQFALASFENELFRKIAF